jgi:uncharacterized protein with von Willebrand factor type A (vWA) domain
MATRAAGGKGSAKRPSGVSMETFDNNFDRIFGKKKAVINNEPVTFCDVFELTNDGYRKAKAWLQENGLEDEIQKEQSVDGFTLTALANKLYNDKSIQSNIEANTICERLLDSEEHACEAAIPPIAEEAVEMIRKLQNEIETLKCRLHTTKQ